MRIREAAALHKFAEAAYTVFLSKPLFQIHLLCLPICFSHLSAFNDSGSVA